MTGEPGVTEVEMAVRHFPCCWMRWSLNSHAYKAGDVKGRVKIHSDGWIEGLMGDKTKILRIIVEFSTKTRNVGVFTV